MGDPIAGVGTQLRRWNSGVWESISNVKNIDGPGMDSDFIDTTALDTAGGYRTFIRGFRDGGELNFTINFTRDVWETMLEYYESDTIQNFELVFPDSDNTSCEFEGYVKSLPLAIPPDDVVSSVITIKISGQVTLNSGSGPSPASVSLVILIMG